MSKVITANYPLLTIIHTSRLLRLLHTLPCVCPEFQSSCYQRYSSLLFTSIRVHLMFFGSTSRSCNLDSEFFILSYISGLFASLCSSQIRSHLLRALPRASPLIWLVERLISTSSFISLLPCVDADATLSVRALSSPYRLHCQ